MIFFLVNSYLCRTKKADVARVEKRTYICSHTRAGAKPTPHEGIKSKLGHWMHPDEMDAKLEKDFAGCMEGPFSIFSHYSLFRGQGVNYVRSFIFTLSI